MNTNPSAKRTFSLLLVMDALLALGCILGAICEIREKLSELNHFSYALYGVSAVLFALLLAGCLLAQSTFARLCIHLKKNRSFVPETARLLHRITLLCSLNTALLCADLGIRLRCAHHYFTRYGGTYDLIDLLWPADASLVLLLVFMMSAVTLIVWVLELLTRRAILLQQENDGTV